MHDEEVEVRPLVLEATASGLKVLWRSGGSTDELAWFEAAPGLEGQVRHWSRELRTDGSWLSQIALDTMDGFTKTMGHLMYEGGLASSQDEAFGSLIRVVRNRLSRHAGHPQLEGIGASH